MPRPDDIERYARLSSMTAVLFGALLVAALILVHSSPGLSASESEFDAFYAGESTALVTVSLNVVPFAGIAFLWHMNTTCLLIRSRTPSPSPTPDGLQLLADILFVALAQRAGSAPTRAIVTKLRQHAGDRTTARVLNVADSLFDAVVHSQDIARPLGRELAIPVDFTRAGLDRVWAMGWPFNAPKKLVGLRLTATDTDWSVGTGPEITGSAIALLLLLTGRSAAAIDELDGMGVSRLRL